MRRRAASHVDAFTLKRFRMHCGAIRCRAAAPYDAVRRRMASRVV